VFLSELKATCIHCDSYHPILQCIRCQCTVGRSAMSISTKRVDFTAALQGHAAQAFSGHRLVKHRRGVVKMREVPLCVLLIGIVSRRASKTLLPRLFYATFPDSALLATCMMACVTTVTDTDTSSCEAASGALSNLKGEGTFWEIILSPDQMFQQVYL
jgi:hypothetical protein